jgi:hypothetical protein
VRRICLLQRVIEEKIEGRTEVARRRGRRRKELVGELKEKRGYWKLKAEAQDHTLWRLALEEPVDHSIRQTTY